MGVTARTGRRGGGVLSIQLQPGGLLRLRGASRRGACQPARRVWAWRVVELAARAPDQRTAASIRRADAKRRVKQHSCVSTTLPAALASCADQLALHLPLPGHDVPAAIHPHWIPRRIDRVGGDGVGEVGQVLLPQPVPRHGFVRADEAKVLDLRNLVSASAAQAHHEFSDGHHALGRPAKQSRAALKGLAGSG